MKKKFARVLVANRGEIAVRIIRTLKLMGIESVAIFSDVDKNSYHLKIADYACHLEGNCATETYLNQEAIIKAINDSGADAVHPGYGFLAENHLFAQAVSEKTRAKFIGPSADVIKLMGSKTAAREFLFQHKIPLVPGLQRPLKNFKELETFKHFPLILKASAGGGGRGMHIVYHKKDLKESYERCKREALAYFGDDQIII